MQQYPQNTPQQPGQQSSYLQNTQQQFGQQSPYPQSTPVTGQPFPYPQNTPQQPGRRFQYNFTSKQMRRYFYNLSMVFIGLLIAGAFLLLLGIAIPLVGVVFIVFGLIIAAIGAVPLIIHYSSRPSDEQYAKWVSERSQSLYRTALQRLHLDESQCERVIKVEGGISSLQQLTKKFPEKEITVKRLQDGSRHYSINVCMYIFLTKNDLAIYSGYINAFAQNERFEDADHYYYKDIVGVSTSGPIYTPAGGFSDREIQRQGFFVRISNGEVVGTDYATKVELGDAKSRVQVEGVDDVVAGLLSLLRDHNVAFAEANKMAKDHY